MINPDNNYIYVSSSNGKFYRSTDLGYSYSLIYELSGADFWGNTFNPLNRSQIYLYCDDN